MKLFKYFSHILLISASAAFAQEVTGLSNWTLYLDPGHSRRENVGEFGYSEAEKNVRVALNLHELLLTHTDIDTVYLCRTNDDVLVGLYDRQDEANLLKVDWYHSIHGDAGAPANNSTLLLWGQYEYGGEKYPQGGKAMSDIMINRLTSAMRTYTVYGSIGDCTFYGCSGGPYLAVNRRTNMASELSEAGFHTNPAQNQRNMNAEWKRLEAWSFLWSILEYHGLPHVESRSLAGYVRNSEGGGLVNGALIEIVGTGMEYTTDTYESLFYKYSSDPELLANGFYFFENIPDADSVLVRVTAPGYYSDSTFVKIIDDAHTFLDLDLVSRAAPTVLSTVPSESDTAFPAWDPVFIYFNRPMDTLSVRQALSLDPSADMEFHWNDSFDRLIIIADLDYVTSYILTISNTASDQYGHLLNSDTDSSVFVLSFTTEKADITEPKIKFFYADQAFNAITMRPVLSLVYDDLLDTASIRNAGLELYEYRASENKVDIEWTYTPFDSLSLISVFSMGSLKPNTIYALKVGAGLTDLFENSTQTSMMRTFSTGDTDYDDVTVLDNFNAGVGNYWDPQASGSTTGIITEKTSRTSSQDPVMLNTGSTASLKFSYGYDTGAANWLVRLVSLGGSSSNNRHFSSSNNIMQVSLFGDGTGNLFRFCVDDNVTASGKHEVSPWIPVTWHGWKKISWDLTSGETGTWIGDGILDGTLSFDSFQFGHDPAAPATGTFYLDDFKIVSAVNLTSLDAETGTGIAVTPFLSQNYPNPFNGGTRFSFTLPSKEFIHLKLTDLNGKFIKMLAEGDYPEGRHWVTLDSRNLSSGIYFYTLETGSSYTVKRMIVLK